MSMSALICARLVPRGYGSKFKLRPVLTHPVPPLSHSSPRAVTDEYLPLPTPSPIIPNYLLTTNCWARFATADAGHHLKAMDSRWKGRGSFFLALMSLFVARCGITPSGHSLPTAVLSVVRVSRPDRWFIHSRPCLNNGVGYDKSD